MKVPHSFCLLQRKCGDGRFYFFCSSIAPLLLLFCYRFAPINSNAIEEQIRGKN